METSVVFGLIFSRNCCSVPPPPFLPILVRLLYSDVESLKGPFTGCLKCISVIIPHNEIESLVRVTVSDLLWVYHSYITRCVLSEILACVKVTACCCTERIFFLFLFLTSSDGKGQARDFSETKLIACWDNYT
jgi:hypothetical protein